MGFFNYTSKVKPKSFTYVPVYYDEEKERREKMYEDYDENDPEAMKTRISSGFKRKSMYFEKPDTTKQRKQSTIRVLIIIVILILILILFFDKNQETILRFGQ